MHAHRRIDDREFRGSRTLDNKECKTPKPDTESGKGHSEVQKAMRKKGETYGLGRVSIRDSTQGSKKVSSVQQKGERRVGEASHHPFIAEDGGPD